MNEQNVTSKDGLVTIFPPDVPCLGIIASPAYHCEPIIRGDRKGLNALRKAIVAALAEGRGETEHVYPHDGEGYTVIVELAPQGTGCPHTYLCEVGS